MMMMSEGVMMIVFKSQTCQGGGEGHHDVCCRSNFDEQNSKARDRLWCFISRIENRGVCVCIYIALTIAILTNIIGDWIDSVSIKMFVHGTPSNI